MNLPERAPLPALRRGERVAKGRERVDSWGRVVQITCELGGRARCPSAPPEGVQFRTLRAPLAAHRVLGQRALSPEPVWATRPWESHRSHVGESPGITLPLPGDPPTSAGPRNISRACDKRAEGSFRLLGPLRKANKRPLSLSGGHDCPPRHVRAVSASLMQSCQPALEALITLDLFHPSNYYRPATKNL
jgi:hypothetical protein